MEGFSVIVLSCEGDRRIGVSWNRLCCCPDKLHAHRARYYAVTRHDYDPLVNDLVRRDSSISGRDPHLGEHDLVSTRRRLVRIRIWRSSIYRLCTRAVDLDEHEPRIAGVGGNGHVPSRNSHNFAGDEDGTG